MFKMEIDTEDVVKQLASIETVAEDILTDKQQIVTLDKQRNKCREATRNLKKGETTSGKAWVCFGNTFVKMDSKKCQKMLETDQKTIDEEINELRDGLKDKVNRLHKMEGTPEVRGFNLKGMKVDDVLYINS